MKLSLPAGFLRNRPARGSLLLVVFLLTLSPTLNAQVAPGDLLVEPLATDLMRPLGIAHAGDGSGRLFIAEKTGRIMVWDGTQVLSTPFLDLSARISAAGGEQGLLGLAFHPRFEVTGFFYVNYTNLVGATVVARYSVSVDPNVADPASEMVLLTIPQPSANHSGGHMAFGPDDFLYIATGDGGSGGDSLNNGQSLDTLLGKILRIDVGQNTREEIDFQPAASPGGENYGWRLMEGSLCFNPPSSCNDGTLTLPIIEYDHADGQCSVTGGFRYRGSRFPALQGVYLYADFCTGRIWGPPPTAAVAGSAPSCSTPVSTSPPSGKTKRVNSI